MSEHREGLETNLGKEKFNQKVFCGKKSIFCKFQNIENESEWVTLYERLKNVIDGRVP